MLESVHGCDQGLAHAVFTLCMQAALAMFYFVLSVFTRMYRSCPHMTAEPFEVQWLLLLHCSPPVRWPNQGIGGSHYKRVDVLVVVFGICETAA